MKLRIRGNSVRLRVVRSEVARLAAGASVEEIAEFGPGQILRYSLQSVEGLDRIRASFESGTIRVVISSECIRQWASSDEVGIYGDSGSMQVLIEKDFRCLTRPEERFDSEVYPHPDGYLVQGHAGCHSQLGQPEKAAALTLTAGKKELNGAMS